MLCEKGAYSGGGVKDKRLKREESHFHRFSYYPSFRKSVATAVERVLDVTRHGALLKRVKIGHF